VSEALPPDVRTALTEARSDCSEGVKLQKGFLKRRDINGDGNPDFIIDFSEYTCEGSAIYCGTAGCLTQIFASKPGGSYVKVLDENVQSVKFSKASGRPAMTLGLHGTACGKAGVEPCRATLYWNGERFSPAR
jgi:hypothetical protein